MTGPGGASQFWSRGWFWALLALVSLAPFVFAPMPMMPDYFSHTARYHVMNHGAESPFLSRYFSFHWALVGNLGVDLLMVPLGHLFPTETAALIAAALIPPLTIAGIFAVAKAAWGRVEAPTLLALPFVYTYSFLFGFVNYHLALALALLVFALWIRGRAWPLAVRWAIYAPLAMVVWIAHVAGWAVLVVVAGCWELGSVLKSGAITPRALLAAGLRTAPLALPLVAIVVWRGAAGATAPSTYNFVLKATWLIVVLKSEVWWLDIATVGLLGLAAAWLLVARGVRRDMAILFAAGGLGLCFVALPSTVFGSFYADERLLPAFAMMLFLSVAVSAGRARTVIALLGLALFGVRLTATTYGWRQRGEAAVAELKALDAVPRGSRIAVMATPSYCESWQLHGREQLPSLAIIRREAFVNTEWDVSGAQLMRPVYNEGRGFNDSTSSFLTGLHKSCQGRTLPVMLAALPRDRFDFIWVFDRAVPPTPWLRPVFAGPHGRLYAIVHPRPD
ncbi:MAG TPA: hypothetical protein VHY32_10565 [Caulobacteraceae bacterium]|jgi:hypothetical protein|nr:hypothetical protein [Caulobacteraceae bacterium]